VVGFLGYWQKPAEQFVLQQSASEAHGKLHVPLLHTPPADPVGLQVVLLVQVIVPAALLQAQVPEVTQYWLQQSLAAEQVAPFWPVSVPETPQPPPLPPEVPPVLLSQVSLLG
jgi:hypothetical protein